MGLSVLASFEATRFSSLDPSPSATCLTTSPSMPLCAKYLGSLEVSLIKSYDQVFTVMAGLLIVAFFFALFLQGRLPKGPAKSDGAVEEGAEPAPSAESTVQDSSTAQKYSVDAE